MRLATRGLAAILLIVLLTVNPGAWAADPQSAEYVVQATIPRNGSSMAFGFGSLWMMSESRRVWLNAADKGAIGIEIPSGEGRYDAFCRR
jgi:hypothetical protein